MDVEILLTGSEVAKLLNTSRSMAYILMRRGGIRVVRIGRSVRVRPADLQTFISTSCDPRLPPLEERKVEVG